MKKPSKRQWVSYGMKQTDLFSPGAEQIKQLHLNKLRVLREEFVAKIEGRPMSFIPPRSLERGMKWKK
jgi:hypothetical protein